MKSYAEKLSVTSEWFCSSPRLETVAASQCSLEFCRGQGLPGAQDLERVPQSLSGYCQGRADRAAPGTCLRMWDRNRPRLGWAAGAWHEYLEHGHGMGSPEELVQSVRTGGALSALTVFKILILFLTVQHRDY